MSASSKSCNVIEEPEQTVSMALAGGGSMMMLDEEPSLLLPAFSPSPFADFIREFEDPQEAYLDGLFGVMLASHAPLAGVDFSAQITIIHSGPGEETTSDGCTLSGRILEDGQFAVDRSYSVPASIAPDGVGGLMQSSERWNGRYLSMNAPTAENLLAVAPAYPNFERFFNGMCRFTRIVEAWMYSPLDLNYFPGTVYQSSGDPAVNRLYHVHDSGSGSWVDREIDYFEMGGVLHPQAVRTLDSAGNIRRSVSFRAFAEIEGGVWRPMRVTSTDYLEGNPDGRKVVVTLTMNRMQALTADDQLPSPPVSARRWELWME